jgi:hypothetical protein
MDMPQVGDVWEMDGFRRRVVDVGRSIVSFYDSQRSVRGFVPKENFFDGAKLVERDGKAVGNE